MGIIPLKPVPNWWDVTEKHRHVIDGILPRLQSIFEESSVPAVLDPGNTALDVIQDRLLERGTTLMDMVKVFEVFIKSPESESPDEIIRLLETLQGVRNIRKELEIDNEVQRYLKHRHQGLDTDFTTINPILSWCNDLRNSRLPSPVKDWLANPEASARLAELQSAISLLLPKWREIREIVGKLDQFGTFKWHEWLNDSDKTAENISARTNVALNHLDKLLVWADFSRALYYADKLGLSAITNLALDGSLNSRDVNSAFRYCFYNSIARNILRHSPDLVVFSGLSHEEVRKKFAELDRDIIRLTAERCIYRIDRMPVPQGNTGSRVVDYTNMYLLRHEIGKKTRHIPIRQLVSRASAALKALKPCFMMGPLSVAQYLERTLEFDIVVMDEASQVRPEESLGAIARGKQIVVVGDTKQLPPTTFFDRLLGETDDVEEEMPMEGLESILHICKTIYPSRILRWHYRSKHESLIAFSNRNFYDNRLVVFPSPHGHNKGLGLRFHYISNALYENRRNYEEAKQVVDAVINHSLECPDESLGVVTLNICQRDLIEEEVERRIKHYPEAEVILEKWEKEFFPFFVKNLENVQGDERDVIFISTTFGRNPQGVVRQQFGPINQETGWRRLNVLFTRARRRVELFTSMQPEDIIVDHSSRRGVKALRDYILYVKQGILESPEYTEREPDSDFEIAVADVLKDHGYAVVPQLGVANFFIDMAVKNPFNPGEFLAAIECDGATYHSARSVRERDRLRQQILENLGWKGKIYRIWSTDWFKDPRHQIQRLLEFLGHLQQKAQAEVPVRAAMAFQSATPAAVYEDVIPVKTLCVEVGDFVTYCDMERPDDRKAVQIVREHGDLNLGTIGVNVPLAQALLGAEVGDEVELNIPGRSKRMLRIIDIER